MSYYIYTKNDVGAYDLAAIANSYDEVVEKYSAIIKYKRIQDILLTETIPYTVVYDSETRKYTANYTDINEE